MDIGLDGVKFEKSDICKGVGGQISDLQRGLSNTISMGRNFASRQISNSIQNIVDDVDFSETLDIGSKLDAISGSVDDKLSGINSLKEKIVSKEIVEGSGLDVATVVECLSGISLPGLPDDLNSPVSIGDMGNILNEAGNWIADNVSDLLSEALNPLEKALHDSLESLKGLLNIPGLDSLLQLTQCLADCPGGDFQGVSTSMNQYRIYCLTEQKEYTIYASDRPGTYACPTDPNHVCDEELAELVQTGVMSDILIEEQLSSVGLSITGEIDWDSAIMTAVPLPGGVKDTMTAVSSLTDNVKDQIAVAKDFNPLPQIPDLPALPEFSNPLPIITPPTIPDIPLPEPRVPELPGVPDFKLQTPAIPEVPEIPRVDDLIDASNISERIYELF